MKKFLTLLFIITCGQVYAANYYFSQSIGNDSRSSIEAQNPATPWQSLTKAQTVFTTGNNLYFQRGDVWVGTLNPQGSGTFGTRITIDAFGSGAKPVITGFGNVSSWTNTGGNIWESTSAVSTLSTCNIASINGANYSQGRTPNSGYWTIGSTNGASTITSTSLNALTTNWSGAQVVMRKYRWVTDKFVIASASGNTITFTSSGDNLQAGYGFFIMNDRRCLDLTNEWSYNSTTKKISIYSTSTPVNVKVPTIETAIDLNTRNYITINNIAFSGFNSFGVYGVNGNAYINVTNCDFNIIGNSAVYTYLSGNPGPNNCTISGNTITDMGSMGIHLGYGSNSLITQNSLLRTGHYPGMGANGDVSYSSIVNFGDDHTISYNVVRAAGYCGIRWDGDNTMVRNNYVDSVCYVKDDGGGIYVYPQITGPSNAVTYSQRTVRDNIITNSIGAAAGGAPSSDYGEAMGIYNDGTSPNVNYINNTISSCYYGLFSNSGKDMLVDSNTIFDCRRGLHVVKYSTYDLPRWTITNNILVAKELNQYAAYYEPGAGAIPATWILDNNVYARPLDDNETIWVDFNATNNYFTLAQWKSVSGKDVNSTKSPMSISSTADFRLDYNPTSVATTVTFPYIYRDMRNATFPGSASIPAYGSRLYIADGIAPPQNIKRSYYLRRRY